MCVLLEAVFPVVPFEVHAGPEACEWDKCSSSDMHIAFQVGNGAAHCRQNGFTWLVGLPHLIGQCGKGLGRSQRQSRQKQVICQYVSVHVGDDSHNDNDSVNVSDDSHNENGTKGCCFLLYVLLV